MQQYHIKTTEEFGRGLYASYDLQPEKILFTAELLVLSPSDTVKVNDTDLKYYTFKFDQDREALVLGDGEIFNHSDAPNIGYKLIPFEDRKIMMFYTLRPIVQGEQLFIDYSSDVKVDVSNYKVNLV